MCSIVFLCLWKLMFFFPLGRNVCKFWKLQHVLIIHSTLLSQQIKGYLIPHDMSPLGKKICQHHIRCSCHVAWQVVLELYWPSVSAGLRCHRLCRRLTDSSSVVVFVWQRSALRPICDLRIKKDHEPSSMCRAQTTPQNKWWRPTLFYVTVLQYRNWSSVIVSQTLSQYGEINDLRFWYCNILMWIMWALCMEVDRGGHMDFRDKVG